MKNMTVFFWTILVYGDLGLGRDDLECLPKEKLYRVNSILYKLNIKSIISSFHFDSVISCLFTLIQSWFRCCNRDKNSASKQFQSWHSHENWTYQCLYDNLTHSVTCQLSIRRSFPPASRIASASGNKHARTFSEHTEDFPRTPRKYRRKI